jgi:hypothetical protein
VTFSWQQKSKQFYYHQKVFNVIKIHFTFKLRRYLEKLNTSMGTTLKVDNSEENATTILDNDENPSINIRQRHLINNDSSNV